MSLIFNGNADLDSVVYNGNEVEVVMCDGVEVWRRIKYVDVPTLSGTSYSTTGGTVGPTVNGFDSSIMTQEGTVSANWPGTYTVTWKLKDTKKYCWADGTTDAKSVSWTVTGGNITFYVNLFWHGSTTNYTTTATFNVAYGQNFGTLMNNNVRSSATSGSMPSWAYTPCGFNNVSYYYDQSGSGVYGSNTFACASYGEKGGAIDYNNGMKLLDEWCGNVIDKSDYPIAGHTYWAQKGGW